MPQHATRTSFQPGQIANPTGKNGADHRSPVVPAEVLEAARAKSLSSIATLVKWRDSNDARASCFACNALLDRAWGKPEQSMHLAGSLDVTARRAETEMMVEALKRLSIEELRTLIGLYKKAGMRVLPNGETVLEDPPTTVPVPGMVPYDR